MRSAIPLSTYEAPALGDGWLCHIFPRATSQGTDSTYKVYQAPDGKRFRSLKAAAASLPGGGLVVDGRHGSNRDSFESSTSNDDEVSMTLESGVDHSGLDHATLVAKLQSHMSLHGLSQGAVIRSGLKFSSQGKLSLWMSRETRAEAAGKEINLSTEKENEDAAVANYLNSHSRAPSRVASHQGSHVATQRPSPTSEDGGVPAPVPVHAASFLDGRKRARDTTADHAKLKARLLAVMAQAGLNQVTVFPLIPFASQPKLSKWLSRDTCTAQSDVDDQLITDFLDRVEAAGGDPYAAAAPRQETCEEFSWGGARNGLNYGSLPAKKDQACRFCGKEVAGTSWNVSRHEQTCLAAPRNAGLGRQVSSFESYDDRRAEMPKPKRPKPEPSRAALGRLEESIGAFSSLVQRPQAVRPESVRPPSPRPDVVAAEQAAADEGLELERDTSEPTGYFGVRAHAPTPYDELQYSAVLTLICARDKERRKVLGNSFTCAEAAALALARAKKSLADGVMPKLPF